MIPVFIELPSHTRGDTWEGLQIGPVLFDGAVPTNTLTSCRLYFRNRNEQLGYGFDSEVVDGYGIITIIDEVTWMVAISDQVINLEAGTWYWDFETTDSLGIIRTLYTGTIKIVGDITY